MRWAIHGSPNTYLVPYHIISHNITIYNLKHDVLPLTQVDVRKWLNHFFTHIHEYDNDYSRDLLELLPHCLKQKGILTIRGLLIAYI